MIALTVLYLLSVIALTSFGIIGADKGNTTLTAGVGVALMVLSSVFGLYLLTIP